MSGARRAETTTAAVHEVGEDGGRESADERDAPDGWRTVFFLRQRSKRQSETAVRMMTAMGMPTARPTTVPVDGWELFGSGSAGGNEVAEVSAEESLGAMTVKPGVDVVVDMAPSATTRE